jgi:hypothetical protein
LSQDCTIKTRAANYKTDPLGLPISHLDSNACLQKLAKKNGGPW